VTVVPTSRTVKIIIRCEPKIKRQFEVLAARLGVKNYEELLRKLIEKADNEWFAAERIY
jgi:hypothetical protein